jgi:(2R)-sulfolactate sulfo-lyase subunit alpha
MAHKFVVVTRADDVGVAIEEIHAAEQAQGFFLEDGSTIEVRARADIPLGHKVALCELMEGAPVKKYGELIGTASAKIGIGEHVHTHNLKSQRQS